MKVTVRESDTFFYYSQLFDIPLALILASNRELDAEQLQPEQQVSIPGYVKHAVKIGPGDSLWRIATQRQLPLDALLLMNPKLDPYHLNAGDSVSIPIRMTKSIIKGNQAYDYQTMIKDINRLSAVYPFIRQQTVGQSVLGKKIPEIQIGQGQKQLHINGAFHAREWITTPVIMTFLNDYLLSLTNRRTLRGLSMAPFYETTTLSIVPMVNVDGVDLVIHGADAAEERKADVLKMNGGQSDFSQWKANIHGVDLNDQFPAGWDIEQQRREQSPGPADYPGAHPLSEPEAKAIAELTKQRDFERVIAFHTQGEEFYWGFEKKEPPEAENIATEFARVSGYKPIQYVDSYAGYKDWFINEWRKPGFTVELGREKNPVPLSQFAEIYQKALGIFLANFYM
ncbi:peptidase M14 [Pullulanibacillus camelliae]|uniref:Peptidase M14 n=1 Tax=Pullulanibacillus camelliae TaxID=1707096 RepID=A0A8J3DWL8_9BACL|nr:M14 family metallopeptidase [Pullulanibacillus camelliae]GGE46805.1 peptidase M14 [Pullulanibacillus camelliae]